MLPAESLQAGWLRDASGFHRGRLNIVVNQQREIWAKTSELTTANGTDGGRTRAADAAFTEDILTVIGERI